MSVAAEVLVLFILVLAGMLARFLGYLSDEVIHGLTDLVLSISLPCLLLYNMQRPFSPEVLGGFVLALVFSAASMLLSLGVSHLLFGKKPQGRRALLNICMMFTNCGFVGYPIILSIQPDWMIYAVAYNIASNLLFWSVGVWLFEKRHASPLSVLRCPALLAALTGFALFCLRFTWPAFLYRSLGLLGGLTTPLSMLLIGARVYGLPLRTLREGDYAALAALRLLGLPLLVYLLLRPIPAPSGVRETVALLTGMPIGSTVLMLCERDGGDVAFASSAIALTTLLCLLTIPMLALPL